MLSDLPASPGSLKTKWLTALWLIAPIRQEQTLVLEVPMQRAIKQLTPLVDGEWVIDGGMRFARPMPYRDLQAYTGVMNEKRFQIIGPFSTGGLPMILHGTLYTQGQNSYLHLTLETSLVKSLVSTLKMALPVLACLGVGAGAGWWLGVEWEELASAGLSFFVVGGMFGVFTYLNFVRCFHHQSRLLLHRLTSPLRASPAGRTRRSSWLPFRHQSR